MAYTTTTSPSEDIIVQEGTFAFSYTASGAVYAGQAVYASTTGGDPTWVKAIPASCGNTGQYGTVGVAAYDVADQGLLAVYGPGNICRVIISGTSKCTVGDCLVGCDEGKWTKKVAGGIPSGICAIALETQATADGTAKVLLH